MYYGNSEFTKVLRRSRLSQRWGFCYWTWRLLICWQGIYGYPIEDATHLALEVARQFTESDAEKVGQLHMASGLQRPPGPGHICRLEQQRPRGLRVGYSAWSTRYNDTSPESWYLSTFHWMNPVRKSKESKEVDIIQLHCYFLEIWTTVRSLATKKTVKSLPSSSSNTCSRPTFWPLECLALDPHTIALIDTIWVLTWGINDDLLFHLLRNFFVYCITEIFHSTFTMP